MKKSLIVFFLVFFILSPADAKPQWVSMMDDEQTNYFKAVKKFDRYWSRHFLPNEEEEAHESQRHEKGKETDPRPWLVKLFQSEEKGKEKSNALHIAYKKFNKWKMEMLPYVGEDGRLRSAQQRLEAWEQLQKMSESTK
jgi:hypothetical protein